jgi:signal transduction histidine kinase
MNSLQAIRQQKRTVKGQIGIKTWADTTQIYCSITDDGPGIEQSVRQEIFTPFYTTKERGIGTGLGLSISYDIIVHKHQGQLDFECPPEGGTVFTMALPLQQETASDQREVQS